MHGNTLMTKKFSILKTFFVLSTVLTVVPHAYSASGSIAQEQQQVTSLFGTHLIGKTHQLSQYLKREELTPQTPFTLPAHLKNSPAEIILMNDLPTENRLYSLTLCALNKTEEELIVEDVEQRIDWEAMTKNIGKIPLNEMNVDAARLFVADFAIDPKKRPLPLYFILLTKLLNLAQDHGDVLPRDKIEKCLLSCYQKNLELTEQSFGHTLNDLDFSDEKLAFLKLYASRVVRLADMGGKHAQAFVLSFYNNSPTQKTVDELWDILLEKIPGGKNLPAPETEEDLLSILITHQSFLTEQLQNAIVTRLKTLQVKKAMEAFVREIHGESVDIVNHYGLQGNIYAATLAKLQTIENTFLRNHAQYELIGTTEEQFAEKEKTIFSFITSTDADVHAAIRNFLAKRTRNLLMQAQTHSEGGVEVLRSMKEQEFIFRDVADKISPRIQSESAKLLLDIYEAKLIKEMHARQYNKLFVSYQGDAIIEGETTIMISPSLNPHWKLAEITGVLLDGRFDTNAAFEFIQHYAMNGYKDAQDALVRLNSILPPSEDSNAGIPLDRLFVFHNAGLLE